MTKKHLSILEKIFAAEIQGTLCQLRKSKGVQFLLDDGCILKAEMELPAGRFPVKLKISGYVLTDRGRIIFCESCRDEPE